MTDLLFHRMAQQPEENQTADSTPPAKAKESKGRTFLNRFLSTVWLWALVVVAFWLDRSAVYLVMFLVLSVVGMLEYFRLVPDSGFRRFRWQTLLVTVLYTVVLFGELFGIGTKWAGFADGLAIALLIILISADRIRFGLDGYRTIDEIAITVFGFVYVVILFGFVPRLLHLGGLETDGQARLYVIFLLVVTKFTDTGAYLVGSLIGKHKMIPKISPGKTWQGFGGAILFALLGSYGCCWLFGDQIPLITPLHAGILGVLLALTAVLGDLVESILKRGLAAKDSGQVMPGIGGVLDLIDSILLTAPVLFLYLLLLID